MSSVTAMHSMFSGVTLSTANYDALLTGWSAQTLQSSVVFSGGSSKYCATSARTTLTSAPKSWTITDGGAALSCPPAGSFITTWQANGSNQVVIWTTGGGYNYNVNWGDGSNTF